MRTSLTKDLTQQLRGAVDHAGLTGKFRVRCHEPHNFHDLLHPVKVADNGLHSGKRIQHCNSGVLLGVLRGHECWVTRIRDFTGSGQLTADERKLPGGIHIVPAHHSGYIGGDRGCDFGKLVAKFTNAQFVTGFSHGVLQGCGWWHVHRIYVVLCRSISQKGR